MSNNYYWTTEAEKFIIKAVQLQHNLCTVQYNYWEILSESE